MNNGILFNEEEAQVLESIIESRRDVRGNYFIQKSIPDDILQRILSAALKAPSVGFSQPWEFVVIRDMNIRNAIKASFLTENEKGGNSFEDEKQKKYKTLKLEGIVESDLNIAVFYKPSDGPVLGQTSMKEVGLYSVVCAIQNLWLMARALNVGVGWVSIVDPVAVKNILRAPEQNKLIGYLCLGYVKDFLDEPELEVLGWEKRKTKENVIFYDSFE